MFDSGAQEDGDIGFHLEMKQDSGDSGFCSQIAKIPHGVHQFSHSGRGTNLNQSF